MPRFTRMRSAAAPRSGALSMSVPSKSNRTALMLVNMVALRCFGGGKHVVDAGVVAQPIVFGQGVVFQTACTLDFQVSRSAKGGQLGGLDELGVGVGTFGQHVQHVFSTHNGEQK